MRFLFTLILFLVFADTATAANPSTSQAAQFRLRLRIMAGTAERKVSELKSKDTWTGERHFELKVLRLELSAVARAMREFSAHPDWSDSALQAAASLLVQQRWVLANGRFASFDEPEYVAAFDENKAAITSVISETLDLFKENFAGLDYTGVPLFGFFEDPPADSQKAELKPINFLSFMHEIERGDAEHLVPQTLRLAAPAAGPIEYLTIIGKRVNLLARHLMIEFPLYKDPRTGHIGFLPEQITISIKSPLEGLGDSTTFRFADRVIHEGLNTHPRGTALSDFANNAEYDYADGKLHFHDVTPYFTTGYDREPSGRHVRDYYITVDPHFRNFTSVTMLEREEILKNGNVVETRVTADVKNVGGFGLAKLGRNLNPSQYNLPDGAAMSSLHDQQNAGGIFRDHETASCTDITGSGVADLLKK